MTSTPEPETVARRGRIRWAAVGAAVAVALGAGGIGAVNATTGAGDRAIYRPIDPCRLVDTRSAPFTVGPRSTPLRRSETMTVAGWGSNGECDLPAGTSALTLNVTAVGATAPTYLQFAPAGRLEPGASSSLNPVPGQPPTPNAVTTPLNGKGAFDVYNLQGSVDVIVDVVGVFDDHHHDDRYYRKQQTYTKAEVDAAIAAAVVDKADAADVYAKTELDAARRVTIEIDRLAIDFDESPRTYWAGYPNSPSGGPGIVTIPIPRGAVIESAVAHVFRASDGNAGTLDFEVAFQLHEVGGPTVTGGSVVSTDGPSGLVAHELIDQPLAPIAPGQSAYLYYSAPALASAFAGLEVTYVLPPITP